MFQASYGILAERGPTTSTMRALVFRGPNQVAVESVPIPRASVGEAVIKITLTTICGTDLHILKGEYPVRPGLIIGHEPVGIIHELGEGVTGYKIGERVLVGAITPCGQCNYCLGEIGLSVEEPSAVGNSGTPFRARKRSICVSQMPRRIWPRSPMS